MTDFSLQSDKTHLESDVDLLLQQIDMLFDTTPREILGSETYGTEYDNLLYELRMSGDEIKQQVDSDLSLLDTLGFSTNVNVHLLKGTEQDIALVEINLTRDDRSFNRIYKIS